MPWAWCNLRRNPFGELTPDERAAVAVVDTDRFLEILRQGQVAIQLLGAAGRGKSTRLLALRQRIPASAYVYLPEDAPCPPIPRGLPLLIDEAQRLPRRIRRPLLATGLPLVLATHRDLSGPLRRAGYRVYPQSIDAVPSPERVREIVRRRVDLCRLGPGPVPSLSRPEAEKLVRRFGSDLRSMEAFLYEQVQRQAHHHGQMRFID